MKLSCVINELIIAYISYHGVNANPELIEKAMKIKEVFTNTEDKYKK